MKIFGFHFAPLFVPLHRRIETAAAAAWITFILIGASSSWAFFIWGILCAPTLRIFLLLYAVWMFWDRKSVVKGQRRSSAVRGWRWWRSFANYFPVNLEKKEDLPPDRSYLFATFPHGILAIGPFCTFATDACDFSKVFPGLTPHTATLNMNFTTPFIRELSLACGSIPAEESCLVDTLRKKGHAVCLVVGGAEEAFYSKPGEYNILALRRKGFIRVALKSGASIVPTISFGEPEVYDQISCSPGSFLRWTQDAFKRLTGIAPTYLWGRGIFQYTYGMIPFRRRITVVAGAPMHLNIEENPSKKLINKIHAEFCKRLQDLFNQEKGKYIQPEIHLNFVK